MRQKLGTPFYENYASVIIIRTVFVVTNLRTSNDLIPFENLGNLV